ncbi:hypothetical protein [Actinomadura keratinilytica]|uniref:hypothetical protein n=1 Tax=Actinomadura keratinilytica TaxID=547461 RepID=UPI0031E72D1E
MASLDVPPPVVEAVRNQGTAARAPADLIGALGPTCRVRCRTRPYAGVRRACDAALSG